ncbi:ribonuclease III [Mycetocola spongiae]|uniref:ribonuclease III n=1 Tax=Mycetocola spongiae TaxID=2859226 RepID=UPI001CF282EA|nr:ribonuclease III [Mycetocola spongiae]
MTESIKVSDSQAHRGSLSAILGVSVKPELLDLALTHRSFAYENGGIPHNERLEFLGDSVLGLATTTELYRVYPQLPEGELAKMRSAVVSTVALSLVARDLGLGQFLKLGRGEELTGGRDKASILADTVEAILGAVYLDRGMAEAEALVLRLVRPLLADPVRMSAANDPKTALQEIAAARSVPPPQYEITSSGPDHNRSFTATVTVGHLATATGTGTSKKHAEMAAALRAWTHLSS